jgi:hypothetical protein
MGSGAVIHVPGFIEIGSGVHKLIGGIHRDTHRQQRDLISPLCFFFQNKESRLKMKAVRMGTAFIGLRIGACD